MFLSTQPYKGVRDFFPVDMRLRNWLFEGLKEVAQSFGFEEYDAPFLEDFALYAAKSGEELVNQQLYSFKDRGDRHVAIRPEMTPSLARMVAAKFNELPKPIRWFAIPNLYRYERPQRGRLREHYQFNCDLLGPAGFIEDLEIFQVVSAIFQHFRADNFYIIRLNHRGLMDAFFEKIIGANNSLRAQLSRLIDKKDKLSREDFEKGLAEYLDSAQIQNMLKYLEAGWSELAQVLGPIESVQKMEKLLEHLSLLGLSDKIRFDLSIQRGLDYYTGFVFEVYDTSSENPRALFGGGRYDNLLGLFGKNQLSGIGFGMGDVGFCNFLQTHQLLPQIAPETELFVAIFNETQVKNALQTAQNLRQMGLKVMMSHQVSKKLGDQFKVAHKHQIPWVVLQGEEEIKNERYVLKNLVLGTQETLSFDDLLTRVKHPGALL